MINVVNRIKDLMDRKGWSCYELSVQTGISTNSIYDWFKIGSTPSMSNIARICEAMDISLEQFFCGEDRYKLTDEENKVLAEWFALTDLEKKAIFDLIETFNIIKNNA